MFCGVLAERLKAAVLKTVGGKPHTRSNRVHTAKHIECFKTWPIGGIGIRGGFKYLFFFSSSLKWATKCWVAPK